MGVRIHRVNQMNEGQALNVIFRAVHSVKCGAGMLGLDEFP